MQRFMQTVALFILTVYRLTASAQEPWPEGLMKPEGIVKYKPAQFTQAIATTDGRPSINRVHKSRLEAHWHQPGGLQAVPKSTWRSDLYKFLPEPAKVWQQRLPVLNQFGFFQYEVGWTRSYADGTFFADVLSNQEGKVFEVRYREKEAGTWTNYVAYKDYSARPKWFFSIKTTQCNSCHNQAGSGGYGVGLVQGGDTVLSDPFPGLEGRQ